MGNLFKKLGFKNPKIEIQNFILVVIGTFILAFGTAIFLTKLNIVSGGLSGIAIIIQSFFPEVMLIDIVVAIGSVLLWVIAFFFVSKNMAIKTAVSTIIYPLFLSLCLRVPVFIDMANTVAGDGGISNILLCAMFGGGLSGLGLALTFIGGGSTGGTDVIILFVTKHTKLKESLVSFLIDSIIVFISMFVIKNNVINSLCGFISILITALVIEYVYIGSETNIQADIISSQWESISRYVQDVLGKGCTIIHAEGGYKGEERIILRVVFSKWKFDKLSNYIASVDPSAFITYTQTKAVYGEGFLTVKNTKNNKDLTEK